MSDRRVHPETRAGDPGSATYRAGMEKLRRTRRTYAEEMEAVREEEARLGRLMGHREREAFASGFHGEPYAEDLRLLAAHGRLDAGSLEEKDR